MNNVEKALNRVGIAMRSDKDTFKDFNSILNEVSGNWGKYTDVEKAEVATAIAGKMCAWVYSNVYIEVSYIGGTPNR